MKVNVVRHRDRHRIEEIVGCKESGDALRRSRQIECSWWLAAAARSGSSFGAGALPASAVVRRKTR
jgi:hypothetical protein